MGNLMSGGNQVKSFDDLIAPLPHGFPIHLRAR
jgi:hypothetical protein